MDCKPPGSSLYGILQVRILEWVAISFSRGSYQPRDQTRIKLASLMSPALAGRFFPNMQVAAGTNKQTNKNPWCSSLARDSQRERDAEITR